MKRRFDSTAILFMGISGSGKGTQLLPLVEKLQESDLCKFFNYFESGRELRRAAKYDSSMGRLINAGYMVSDEDIIDIFNKFMRGSIAPKLSILDGFPRSMAQSIYLEGFLKESGYKNPIIVLNFILSKECALQRIHERNVRDGRQDDSEKETIERRFNWYNSHVLPLVEHYRKDNRYRVIDIDANQSIENVSALIYSSVMEVSKNW